MPTRSHITAAALIVAVFAVSPHASADEPKPADDAYRNALVAALHRLSESPFDTEHLAAFLKKHPDLVNERVAYRQPRKPQVRDNYTALHFAAASTYGNSEAVKLLIEYKADVNADAGGGWTPLHLAARQGNLDVVKQLVEAGAKVDAKTTALPERAAPSGPPGAEPLMLPAVPALTALDLAKSAKHAEVVKYLSN